MSRNVLSGIILIVTLTSMEMKLSAQQAILLDDNSWWLTPHRLLQTNLREIDATMDTDQYVREAKEFGANIVLFNVGGIVANYPTELEYHWRNTFMKGDLVGEILEKLHKADVKMIGRFDFSKINQKYAANHPEWLY
ncbi:MAG: alpha-amylase family protein, partial [Planctomycetota bacterium]